MTTTSDAHVAETLESEARKVMAERAALPDTWLNREQRRVLLRQVDGLLEMYNQLTLGR